MREKRDAHDARDVARFVLKTWVGGIFLILAAACGGGGGSDDAAPAAAPQAVEEASVAPGETSAILTWEPVAAATSYDVYYSDVPDFSTETALAKYEDVSSPLTVSGLSDDMMHYFIIVACNAQGKTPSRQVLGTQPFLTPDAPQTPRIVAVCKGKPDEKFTLIYWSQVPQATSYRVYWWDGSDRRGMIETPDTVAEHSELVDNVLYSYQVFAVHDDTEGPGSAIVSAMAKGPGGGGSDHEEGFGNNLSVPLVFAEGVGLLGWPTGDDTGLRPRPDQPVPVLPYLVDDDLIVKDGISYYLQGGESTWQAEWDDGDNSGENVILDWGDNLTHQFWTPSSVVRVEVNFYQDTGADSSAPAMVGYEMASLYGEKHYEIWGTTGAEVASSYSRVFTPCARLLIQKLRQDADGTLVVDEAFEPIVDQAVYENFGSDGPGGFGSEVNAAGAVTYGYNWKLKQMPLEEQNKLGWWRLTLKLDPVAKYELVPETAEDDTGGDDGPPTDPGGGPPGAEVTLLAEEPAGEPVNFTIPLNTRIFALDDGDQAVPGEPAASPAPLAEDGEEGEETEGPLFPAILLPDPDNPGGKMSVLDIEIRASRQGGQKPGDVGPGDHGGDSGTTDGHTGGGGGGKGKGNCGGGGGGGGH